MSSPKILESISLGEVIPKLEIDTAQFQEPELGVAARVKVKFPWPHSSI